MRLSILVNAPRYAVWRELRDIGAHVRWMEDAESIKFLSPSQSGVGTRFDCATKVGPFRLDDRMEVIEWKEGRALTIRHLGAVKGSGRFSLRWRRNGTLVVWQEWLRFPAWLGGPVANAVVTPFLRRVWKKNLRNLKAIVEASR
jgi:hypothetical protein